ncbi:GPN-loop GTPase,P-loop containing nucleoside triphosphate hydrolase [Cinara cedri]|uniref:GPN-loop GTPase n=1 Tax=Cinara cedri TaxID=506608 RepID=A0A5E4N586_9HEMI|nr:GPN-loop GTPase,P-loop containing nucleoside triphosphate hydrolase [Cinara cedri]
MDGEVESENGTMKSPVCLIVLGMAGSGKTTFVTKLDSYLRQHKRPPYLVNLDPACKNMPYKPNIDIRDSVRYKQVMKKYHLGPNGAIVTSLNLYSTKFNQLLELLGKVNVENTHDIAVIDTPGQIEVFTWSASGQIITECLASTFPTVVVYVMDLERSTSPVTFMSNMLYACSVLYKAKLPFIIVLNKCDIVDPTYAIEWMHDFEAFSDAIEKETSYMSNLTRTMALTLDEFYNELNYVPVSSLTGYNFDEFLKMVDTAADEFQREYRVEWEKVRKEKLQTEITQLNSKLNSLAVSSGEGEDINLGIISSLSAGREISDVYLAPMANEISDDSEGEEVSGFNLND